MSDTPETDGEWNRIACYEHPQFEQALADFARNLERERDAVEDACEQRFSDVRDVLCNAMPDANAPTKKLAELLVEERDKYQEQADVLLYRLGNTQERMINAERERNEWKEVAEGSLLGAIHERDEARELAANLEISLTAAIRSANIRQDETEHAMHECSELRILVDGLSEMTHELSEDRNLWKTEAEKWRDIAYGNRH